jgi:hypothetical protein
MDTEAVDQQITEARANLSELLAAVRMLNRLYFLNSRNKRQAAVVPAPLGELIERVGGVESAAEILKARLGNDS